MRRAFIALGIVILLALIGGIIAALWRVQDSLPTTAGRIEVEGAQGEISILRDDHGVPHIFAETMEDALFGLGFVHAQDRSWSMQILRMGSQGRLSEMFGEPALESDIFLRTLDLHKRAQEAAADLSDSDRAAIEAYARGVNAGMDRGGARPLEFSILRLPPPAPWTVADSLAVNKMMALDLANDASSEVERLRLLKHIGAERFHEYLPPYPVDAPIALSPEDLGLPADATTPPRRAGTLPAGAAPEAGSNNWVIGGEMSVTGQPLLANDPHLGLSAPSIWYLAHLSFEGRDVVGATIAGLPGITLGRTRGVAWGFTNNGADVQDLYREQVNPDNQDQYLTPQGWTEFETRPETILIKNAEPVTITYRRTRNGPVLPEETDWAKVSPEGEVFSLKWSALEPRDTTLTAALEILRSESAQDLLTALKAFQDPIQSIVFADSEGTHGLITPGRVPVRSPQHTTGGFLPSEGWLPQNQWQGYVPFEDLPSVTAPMRGYVATANNMMVPDAYPVHFTYERAWRRAQRIEDRLSAATRFTLEDMKDLQLDVLAHGAAELTPMMVADATAGSQTAAEALALLSQWDHRMSADQAAPLIFAIWVEAFQRAISEDELGPVFEHVHRPRPDFLAAVLSGEAANWCDDQDTPDIEESCPDMLSTTLSDALEAGMADYGGDISAWRWGEAHPAVHAHTPFEEVALLRSFFSIRTPSEGGFYTVNRGFYGYDGDVLFENRHAGALRAVYDLSRPDGAEFMISTGQSGHVMSKNYKDLAKPWAAGEFIALELNRNVLETQGARALHLTPEAIQDTD